MARNDLHAGRQLREHLADILHISIDVAAAIDVNKGKAAVEEVVAHMHHVRSGKEDHRVAVRMAMRKVNEADLFAVKVDRDALVEGNDGQSILRFCRRFGLCLRLVRFGGEHETTQEQ